MNKKNLLETIDLALAALGDMDAILAIGFYENGRMTSDAVTTLKALKVEAEALTDDPPSDFDVWGEYPEYPRRDWRSEVADNNTNLGYWDWVRHERDAVDYGDLDTSSGYPAGVKSCAWSGPPTDSILVTLTDDRVVEVILGPCELTGSGIGFGQKAAGHGFHIDEQTAELAIEAATLFDSDALKRD